MSCSSSLPSLLSRSLARRGPASVSALRRPLPCFSSTPLVRSLSSTPRRWDSAAPPSISAPTSSSTEPPADGSSGIKATWHPADGSEAKAPLKIDQEPKLSLTFTCTAILDPPEPPASSPEATVAPSEPAEDVVCSHRSTHTFTKQAYTKGIVLVECPGCKNRHLIADHLGWFPEVTAADGGKRVMRNIEDIMKEKGELVKLGQLRGGEGGDIEFY